MEKTIEIWFLSDWHISSGRGDGYRADAVLARDVDGFPCIQGRAVRGALREGARRLGLARTDLRHAETFFWGSPHDTASLNRPGRIRVSSARFPEDIRARVPDDRTREDVINDLTLVHTQTALTAEGTVQPSSLRSIECGVKGAVLQATLTVPHVPEIPDDWIETYFRAVLGATRSIGGNRSRGLGRCRMTFLGETEGSSPVLPGENAFLAAFTASEASGTAGTAGGEA